ncbi:MAG: Ig-like domain-containing protein [Scandinavium sp.]|uniref:Ig-like domain-containing protein n=1 Tax=Scandinavium sp. TaxID=2830653 RepID=UPI003F368C5A
MKANQEYYVQVSLQDPGSKDEIISLPYHFYTTEPGQDGGTGTAPATDIQVLDDEGAAITYIHNGDTTHDHTPTIQGHASANSIVKIFDQGTLLGVTLVDANGNWSYTPAALNDGQHSFSTVVVDTSTGEESVQSAATTFTIETSVLVSGSENFEDVTSFPSNSYMAFASGLTMTAVGTDQACVVSSAISAADPDHPGHKLYADNHAKGISNQSGDGELIFTLPGAAQSVSFDYVVAQEITVYDTDHNVIDHVYPDESSYLSKEWLHYEYTAPQGTEIGSFSVGSGYCWMDNVQWSDTATTMPSQASDIHNSAYDLTNHAHSTMTLTESDVLAHSQQNLYIEDGKEQMAIKGDAGDVVEVNITNFDTQNWSETGQMTAGGVTYDIYQHATNDHELLIQHGVELHQYH